MVSSSKVIVNRGSEWHRWEPHIHTPGTLREDRFSDDDDSWEKYLKALENASPALRVIGITDYCVTRNYERIKSEKEKGRLKNCDLLFPNIELRLNTGTVKGHYVNLHLLASPEDPDHVDELNRFLGRLSFEAHDDRFVCSPGDLTRLGRRADPNLHDDEAALRYGGLQFKVSLENLTSTYRDIKWAQENIIIAVSGNDDGTSGVRESADATLREEIEKAAHVIFASSPKQREFWLGNGAASVKELRSRYGGPKPCIWGSDAHEHTTVAEPAENRRCWIKGQPTFDALRQSCIDPGRAYVGAEPPPLAAPSQVIDEITIDNALWAATKQVKLNPGLVAVIGPRGSGKTALVDMIATGCDSYFESSEYPSFLARAKEHLADSQVTLKWLSDEELIIRSLSSPANLSLDAYPRARYLSQQFVEELCSIEGMPSLIKEIERVVFEAHPIIDRDGTADFEELLALRATRHRDSRNREEQALANVSDQIGVEMEKSRQVDKTKTVVAEKERLVGRYRRDRQALLPKEKSEASERLQEVMGAAETVRGFLRYYSRQQASISGLKNEVQDLRNNRAPETLRSMTERHKEVEIEPNDWSHFLLEYSGDVDDVIAGKTDLFDKKAKKWKGERPKKPQGDNGSFLPNDVELTKCPLALLEAETDRLGKIVAEDKDLANKISAISNRLAEETTALEKLRERLADYDGAIDRARSLVAKREEGYIRVFDAILGEEKVLKDLYAPLTNRLKEERGTLGKLSFTVSRIADVEAWAKRGEKDLFDLRTGPFKGIGSLAGIAKEMLKEAWETGDSATVSAAMEKFRGKYQDALLEKAPFEQSDQSNYRPWSRRFAQWLYSTDHISIEYGIRYGGTDIQKLSPGTRGIVLVLLYLALDDTDDSPLIIDQPEENLDPKSINDELVPLFHKAKRKRQVIMVTHNANLVVNTDADQIIVASAGTNTSGAIPPISYQSGGLDEAHIRNHVCEILEGGETAFKDRARRLRIALQK